MFSWIPIIGPVIDGIVSIFVKTKDTQLEKHKVDTKASVDTLAIFKDDIGVRISRDLIMFPTAVWTALIVWDTIVEHRFPHMVFVVGKFKDGSGLEMLPYAVLTFLFGVTAMNAFRRK